MEEGHLDISIKKTDSCLGLLQLMKLPSLWNVKVLWLSTKNQNKGSHIEDASELKKKIQTDEKLKNM